MRDLTVIWPLTQQAPPLPTPHFRLLSGGPRVARFAILRTARNSAIEISDRALASMTLAGRFSPLVRQLRALRSS